MVPVPGDDTRVVTLLGEVRAGVARTRRSGDDEALVEAVLALDALRRSPGSTQLRGSFRHAGGEAWETFTELADLARRARPARPRALRLHPHMPVAWTGMEGRP